MQQVKTLHGQKESFKKKKKKNSFKGKNMIPLQFDSTSNKAFIINKLFFGKVESSDKVLWSDSTHRIIKPVCLFTMSLLELSTADFLDGFNVVSLTLAEKVTTIPRFIFALN